jgi:hypothetical protein
MPNWHFKRGIGLRTQVTARRTVTFDRKEAPTSIQHLKFQNVKHGKANTMAKRKTALILAGQIERAILQIRGEKVLLDTDLAALYGVATSQFNRAVQRNLDRFPDDFMFQLSEEETETLRCQNGISKGRIRLRCGV